MFFLPNSLILTKYRLMFLFNLISSVFGSNCGIIPEDIDTKENIDLKRVKVGIFKKRNAGQ